MDYWIYGLMGNFGVQRSMLAVRCSQTLSARPQTERPARAQYDSLGQSATLGARRPRYIGPITQPLTAKPRDSAKLICGTPCCHQSDTLLCVIPFERWFPTPSRSRLCYLRSPISDTFAFFAAFARKNPVFISGIADAPPIPRWKRR
jgi:hypothetical protein